jgi:transposase
MKHSQKQIISTIRTAMQDGVIAAAKAHKVSDATVYDWCRKAKVTPAANKPSIDWEQVAASVMKGIKN